MSASFTTQVRGRFRAASNALARYSIAGKTEEWSAPLIGSRSTGAPVDLLAPVGNAAGGRGQACGTGDVQVAQPEPGAPSCLIVTSQLDFGGLAEVVSFLALGLPAYGISTAVLAVTPNGTSYGRASGRAAALLRSCGVVVIESDERGVDACVRRMAPDVISAHGAPVSVFAAAVAHRVPYVDYLHAMYSVTAPDYAWHGKAHADGSLAAVVVVSELLRRDYLSGNPDCPPERVVTIPNAVRSHQQVADDRAAVRARLGLTDEFLFVSLARVSLEKNTYGLVAAFGEMAAHRPEAHLVLAGRLQDARYVNRILRLRDSLPCGERVHIRGSTATPHVLLAAADGFALNSFHEGGPLSSMEALCAGIPVVLSDVGSAREQVEDDPARGYVVTNPLGAPLPVSWEAAAAARYRPQVNRVELASRMDDLVAARDKYAAARINLAEESRQRFAAERCLSRHSDLLLSVARRLPVGRN